MLLYHGTNGRWLDSILRNGIKPRGRSPARNNWKHVPHQSNPHAVYCTDSYAPYFAFNAARGADPQCAVIEIDTDRLNPVNLFPDEDALEQIGRLEADGVPGTLSQRTLHYRARMFDYNRPDASGNTAWRVSLRALGTCAYRGEVPPSAITRAVTWPHVPNARLMLVWDPTITIMNQRYCGDGYRSLTQRLFAGVFDTEPRSHNWVDPILPPVIGWRRLPE